MPSTPRGKSSEDIAQLKDWFQQMMGQMAQQAKSIDQLTSNTGALQSRLAEMSNHVAAAPKDKESRDKEEPGRKKGRAGDKEGDLSMGEAATQEQDAARTLLEDAALRDARAPYVAAHVGDNPFVVPQAAASVGELSTF